MAVSAKKRNYFVDLLAILFGISAWIGITGAYLQLPIFVETAPEGWTLPSVIVILVQGGNIATLIYVLYEKYSCVRFNDENLIYITLGFGCVAAILMAFFYQTTVEINGESKSVPLYVFTGMFAIVGCLSSVLFMPYMGRFREEYLVTFMFGQALNGFISSVVSLLQGVGTQECLNNNSTNTTAAMEASTPLFGPKIYFIFVFCMLLLSSIAFLLLNKLRVCRKQYAACPSSRKISTQVDESNGSANGYEHIPNHEDSEYLSVFQYYCLMVLIAAISFLSYGILPGLQSFSCLPYGAAAYHFSTTLSSISNPVVCLLTMYFPRSSLRNITFQAVVAAVFTVYILFTALKSPSPPFVSTKFGEITIVCVFNK